MFDGDAFFVVVDDFFLYFFAVFYFFELVFIEDLEFC